LFLATELLELDCAEKMLTPPLILDSEL